jgi:hypothetical protein
MPHKNLGIDRMALLPPGATPLDPEALARQVIALQSSRFPYQKQSNFRKVFWYFP